MSATLPPSRRILFGLVLALGLAVLLLLLFEGALRLAGSGHNPKFYRRTTDPTGAAIVRENRWVTAPYFSRDLVRRPVPFRLTAEKRPAEFRIFVLGSSAAMGDPEPSFSVARVLEKLLTAAYPEIEFSVINAGCTAINSHVVRRIARDCAELQPDLFLVYEGHNEVIGPFGPGTVFTPFLRSGPTTRVVDALKRSRTGQWVNEIVLRRRGPEREWGGLEMFLERRIRWEDSRLLDVRERFTENLLDIARAGERVGALTWIATVLTNQRDFAPFLSGHRDGLSASEEAEWKAAVAAGEIELQAGRVALAENRYRHALAIDDQHAELTFRLARLTLGQGRLDDAKRLFQRALDLDLLRFRADSRLNEAIRSLVAPGLDVLDLERAAAAASAGGIIGDEFLLEHVHLTMSGTYFIAQEIFRRLGDELVRQGRTPHAVRESLTIEEVRQRLGYTNYEQVLIIRELLARYGRPPFTSQLDHTPRVQAWVQRERAAQRLLAQPESREALFQLYESALAMDPADWMLRRNFGMALVAQATPMEALPHLQQVQALIDDDPPTLFALGLAQRQSGQIEEAEATFARLRRLEPNYPGLSPAR